MRQHLELLLAKLISMHNYEQHTATESTRACIAWAGKPDKSSTNAADPVCLQQLWWSALGLRSLPFHTI